VHLSVAYKFMYNIGQYKNTKPSQFYQKKLTETEEKSALFFAAGGPRATLSSLVLVFVLCLLLLLSLCKCTRTVLNFKRKCKLKVNCRL
jgi:hypothetical protein